MKNTSFNLLIILTFTFSGFSQTDSVLFIEDADFSYYRMQKVRYQETGEIKMEKQLTNLEDVKTLKFLNSDSVVLLKHGEIPAYTSLFNIVDVKQYKYRFSPVVGITIGAVSGGLIGGIIGYGVSGNPPSSGGSWIFGPHTDIAPSDPHAKRVGAVVGALIGAVSGGLIGAAITYLINHSTLDLYSVPEKEKKNKLIKFLKQK